MNYYTNTEHFGQLKGDSIFTNFTPRCYSCFHYDKNDYIHCYGTCELQDKDFRVDHICNCNSYEKEVNNDN